MARDVASCACALGVYRASELCAFFECEVLGNDVRLDRGSGADVDTIGNDVALEVPVDRHSARSHGGANPRPGGGYQTMSLELDGAFEETINQHIFTCDQFSLDDQCRSATHGFYFHSSSSFRQAETRFDRWGCAGFGIRSIAHELRKIAE
jgi:hypothetical protein